MLSLTIAHHMDDHEISFVLRFHFDHSVRQVLTKSGHHSLDAE
jgi:hypothetical protein